MSNVSTHDWPASEWHSIFFVASSLNLSHLMANRGWVTVLCQAVSWIMSHPTEGEWWFFARQLSSIVSHLMTNSLWVTLHLFSLLGSLINHPMTNRVWVIIHFFLLARQSHQPCLILWLTGSEWYYIFFHLQGSLINIIPWPTVCEWHSLHAKKSHQSCLILWPTGSEWHCIFPVSFITHVSCLILWPIDSEWHYFFLLIMSDYPMTNSNRGWVTVICKAVLLTMLPTGGEQWLFAQQSHQLCLIPWPTVCKWHWIFFFARQSHQSCFVSWPTVCEWHYNFSLPESLINHVLSLDPQPVSFTVFFPCQRVPSIMSLSMDHRVWVTLLVFLCHAVNHSGMPKRL